MRTGILMLDSWAGRINVPIQVLGETGRKFRIRLASPGTGVYLPGYRYLTSSHTQLVPKHAVRFTSALADRG